MATFYTDVISKDPRFGSLTRVADPSLLEPGTRQLVERIITASQQMGIEVLIYETYRSQDRQRQLFNSGASKLRTVGVHHYEDWPATLFAQSAASLAGKAISHSLDNPRTELWTHMGRRLGEPRKSNTASSIAVHVQRCTVARQGDAFRRSPGIPTKPTIPL